jgi:tetratricopeptide (TPR) repeat protein
MTKSERSRRRHADTWTLALLIVAGGLALAPVLAFAAGSEKRDSSAPNEKPAAYAAGVKLVSDGKFEEARESFERANLRSRKDPEILNMLAYTQRKTGRLDLAIENYRKALALRPDFPEAREYLGEAYLQAALEQLAWLEQAGDAAKVQHRALLRAIHDGANGLEAAPGSARW